MNTVYNTTTERNPIDSIHRNLSLLLELLCPSPNCAGFFFTKILVHYFHKFLLRRGKHSSSNHSQLLQLSPQIFQ